MSVSASENPVFVGSASWIPMPCIVNRLANTPIMKISECAKLISRRTP